MRIAFSGTHRTGKSTLLGQIAGQLPDHATVDEPYHLLEEEGHETPDVPSLEDFEAQLERSLAALEESGTDVLFDRCPADALAYLLAHDDADGFDADAWRGRVREAMATLDLVVFVPLERPDRIPLPAHEDRAFRQDVHEKLEELLLDEGGYDIEVLCVEGDTASRVRQVMARIRRP